MSGLFDLARFVVEWGDKGEQECQEALRNLERRAEGLSSSERELIRDDFERAWSYYGNSRTACSVLDVDYPTLQPSVYLSLFCAQVVMVGR